MTGHEGVDRVNDHVKKSDRDNWHSCSVAAKASEEDADGLETDILLAEGARVMVTWNLWTSKGQ